jgi:hypothetical protein
MEWHLLILLQLQIRDVSERNPHRRGITALLHVAEIDHAATVAGTQLVESSVKSLVFLFVSGGHGVGHYLEQLWCVIAVLAEPREDQTHLQEMAARFRSFTPQAVQQTREGDGCVSLVGADLYRPRKLLETEIISFLLAALCEHDF